MANNKELKLKAGEKGTVIETKKIKLMFEQDSGYVIYATREIAIKAGFKHTDEIMIATAASELATNILRYAESGELFISIIKDINNGNVGLEILASDNGPGIENIEQAMQEQFSSLPHSLGLGLPSVKRIMDEFFIESIPGVGTRVLARKWRLYGKN